MTIQINSTTDFFVKTESDVPGANASNTGVTALLSSIQPNLAVGYYNSSGVTLTDGQPGALQLTASGQLIVALPSSAASAANQVTGNNFLQTLAGAVAGTEVQVDIVSAPVLSVNDGGGSLTVDGTVASTQSGAWTVGLTGSIPLPTGAATESTLTTIQSNTGFGTVVGGGTEATALRVTIANNSTGVLSVDDNGSTLTVDGTVASTQSGAWNVGITGTVPLPTGAATAANQTTLIGHVDGLEGLLTGIDADTAALAAALGTAFPVSATNLDIRDLSSATDSVALGGSVGPVTQLNLTNSDPLTVAIVDANGTQVTSFGGGGGGGGGTEYTEGNTVATVTGMAILMRTSANVMVPLPGDLTNGLLVNLGANNDVVLGAGTANIGDVDVATLPVDFNSGAAGAATLRSVLATRHEAADTPISVRLSDGSAFSSTVTLGAGTANIGDVDVLSLPVDFNSGAAGATTLRSVLATRHEAAATPISVRLSNGSAFDPSLAVSNLDLGATADAAATSDTGTFSLIALFKRYLARIWATKIQTASAISTSGDNTVIAAPAAGTRLVISALRIQNESATATTVLIKAGAGTTLARLRTATDGSGVSEVYPFGTELRLAAATAFVINLSGANAHGVSVQHWVENTTTGLPA
jgi:hypothetical protein